MIIFSGGTGTPKLLDGLKEILPPEELTVVVNTAEDLWVSGNMICPDLGYSALSVLRQDRPKKMVGYRRRHLSD